MEIADRMSRLGTETAFGVLAKAQALEAKGMDVVHLEIGEPDFDTPENIRTAAKAALDNGQTHYCNSQGIVPLRSEIAKELSKTRGVTINSEQVVVAPGAKPIVFFSILSLLEEGDEAICPDPSYPIYESVINFSGAKTVPIQLREELDFRFDIDELRAKVTPHTKLIVLNSPHNPTGGVLEKEEICAIAEIAQQNDITVLSDEVYEHIVYDYEPFSIASLPGMIERTILLSGFSKTYAMTGWRLGYAALPPKLVEPVVRLFVNSVSCTPPFTQHAGIEALMGPQDSVPKMANEFKKRRDLIVNGLNQIPGISCVLPKGAFYAFPNVKGVGTGCEELADILLNKAGVACLPGTHFGQYGNGYLRFSYATSLDKINVALERIEKTVKGLAF